jgi:putative toxin-antitoxin system antitoxin component (TIGR02293 family)
MASMTQTKTFNPRKSILRAKAEKTQKPRWEISTSEEKLTWNDKMDRMALIRRGLPYEAIEVVGSKAELSTKQILNYLGIAQTTYNKKKREKQFLSRRDSEAVLILSELLDFGFEVFNNEKEKFRRWLKKNNVSLGNVPPESLFDSLTGMHEVRNALNRLEYGNMA